MESNLLSTKENVTLEQINDEEVSRQGIIFTWLFVISILGIPSNCLVLHTYRTRIPLSNYKVFIIAVAITDLISCCFAIPLEIFLLFYVYNLRDELTWICKLSRFCNAFLTCSSCFLLLSVAVDRYRKVCKPLKNQISPTLAKVVCIMSIMLGLLVSLPMALIYGKKTIDVKYRDRRVSVVECSTSDAMSHTNTPFYHAVFLGVMAIVGITVVIVLYCVIGCKIKQSSMESHSTVKYTKSSKPGVSFISSSKYTTAVPELVDIQTDLKLKLNNLYKTEKSFEESWTDCASTDDTLDNNCDIKKSTLGTGSKRARNNPYSNTRTSIYTIYRRSIEQANRGSDHEDNIKPACLPFVRRKINDVLVTFRSSAIIRRQSIYQKESLKKMFRLKQARARKSAFTMSIISLIYILTFLPYIIIVTVRTLKKDFVEDLSETDAVFYRFGLRTYFAACGANPLICIACDSRLRAEVKRMFGSFRRCKFC